MLVNYDDLKATLRENVVEVRFIKEDGTRRIMKATLKRDLLPPGDGVNKDPKAENREVIAAWDTELGAWRSFRLDRVESTQVLDVL